MQSITEALAICDDLIQNGDGEVAFILGKKYAIGDGVDRRVDVAIAILRKAIQRNHSKYLGTYVDCLYKSGLKEHLSTCLNVCTKYSSDNKDVAFRLAQMYRNGLGVEKDIDRARVLMESAVKMGHKGAIKELSVINKVESSDLNQIVDEQIKELWNTSTESSLKEMVDKCVLLCDKDKVACLYLARAYRYGKGVGKDDELVKTYYEKSGSKLEYAEYLYSVHDYSKAFELFMLFPDNKDAVFRIAQMYRNGYGVSKSGRLAVNYMKRAIELGHKGAIKELQLMLNDGNS